MIWVSRLVAWGGGGGPTVLLPVHRAGGLCCTPEGVKKGVRARAAIRLSLEGQKDIQGTELKPPANECKVAKRSNHGFSRTKLQAQCSQVKAGRKLLGILNEADGRT